MKKTFAIILSVLMVVSLAAFGVSAAEPAEVASAADFAAMTADGSYKLTADIELSESFATFSGTFDGNGHTVTLNGVPMFTAMNGTVKNLKVKGSVTNDKAGNTAAVCLTTQAGVFENITNEASVINTYKLADPTKNETVRTGGIAAYAGKAAATFTNCVNKGEVSGPEATGGILAESQFAGTSFVKCVNYGKISVPVSKNSGCAAGGICGYSGTGSVNYTDCVNNGEIVSVYRAGGIVGDARKAAVCVGCVNNGKISGENNCGGIIGYDGDSGTETQTVVKNCVNNGEIYDTNQAGGLIGYLYGSGTKACAIIENCINNGKVSAGKYCSEFLGYSNSWANTIKNSIGVGELASIPVEGFPTIFAIMGCSSTQPGSMDIQNVFLVDGGKTEWLSWAAFTTDDANASRRIPLSACLDVDLQGVEFEYPVYASADYTTPSSTVKVVANDDLSAKNGDTVVGIRVKAITRGELNDNLIGSFCSVTGLTVHAENGRVLFGAAGQTPDAPATGDNAVIIAVVAMVAVLGMGVALKARKA